MFRLHNTCVTLLFFITLLIVKILTWALNDYHSNNLGWTSVSGANDEKQIPSHKTGEQIII